MKEASKTNQIRGPQFLSAYLRGSILDIGSGADLVVPHAEPFDLEHGDANDILRYRPAESYDCVHSSHCLEHMHNPEQALAGWWALVKPGGYLIVVVPHEDLYEQGFWPSLFNPDHKSTFRLGQGTSWSPVSFDLLDLVSSLPRAEVVSAEVHDCKYDHSRRVAAAPRKQLRPFRAAACRFNRWLTRRVKRSPVERSRWWLSLQGNVPRIGIPIDQTACREPKVDEGQPIPCSSNPTPPSDRRKASSGGHRPRSRTASPA